MPKKASAPRQWARDEQKEKYWREKIAEWMASGLSIRAFCRKHHLPESSFNAWRREIDIRNREAAALRVPTGAEATSFPPTVEDSRGRVIPTKARQLGAVAPNDQDQLAFVPLTVVPDLKDEDPAPPKTVPVEIRSPKGFRFRINCEADAQFIAEFIRALDD
jgi:transposase-like protein